MKKKQTGGVITGEDLEEAFGDGFWDLPMDERAEMLIKKMLGQNVEKVRKEDAGRRGQSQDVRN